MEGLYQLFERITYPLTEIKVPTYVGTLTAVLSTYLSLQTQELLRDLNDTLIRLNKYVFMHLSKLAKFLVPQNHNYFKKVLRYFIR